MSEIVNFSSLQTLTSADNASEILVRIPNGLSGPSGFGKASLSAVNNSLGVTSTVQANSGVWAGVVEVYNNGSLSSGTFTIDAENGSYQQLTVTGNITLNAPINYSVGTKINVALSAFSTARTVTLSSITVPVGYTFVSSISANNVRLLELYYPINKWVLLSNLEYA